MVMMHQSLKIVQWAELAGVPYQIPEVALKASLTYRSEIVHDVNVRETLPALKALALLPYGTAAADVIAASEGKIELLRWSQYQTVKGNLQFAWSSLYYF